jgi:hypothetical protein
MPSQKIKKVVVPATNLSPVTKDAEYLVRYRIISEDRNRLSHWSPIYKISAADRITEVSSSIDITGNNITITWDDENDRSSYDIFVRFGVYDEATESIAWDNYFYHGTSPIHTYSLLKESGYTDISIVVQAEGIVKEINSILKVAESERSLRSIFDGGSA